MAFEDGSRSTQGNEWHLAETGPDNTATLVGLRFTANNTSTARQHVLNDSHLPFDKRNTRHMCMIRDFWPHTNRITSHQTHNTYTKIIRDRFVGDCFSSARRSNNITGKVARLLNSEALHSWCQITPLTQSHIITSGILALPQIQLWLPCWPPQIARNAPDDNITNFRRILTKLLDLQCTVDDWLFGIPIFHICELKSQRQFPIIGIHSGAQNKEG